MRCNCMRSETKALICQYRLWSVWLMWGAVKQNVCIFNEEPITGAIVLEWGEFRKLGNISNSMFFMGYSDRIVVQYGVLLLFCVCYSSGNYVNLCNDGEFVVNSRSKILLFFYPGNRENILIIVGDGRPE